VQQAVFQIVKAEYEFVENIKIDPEYSLLVPILSDEEYTRLKESIADVGLYEPIIINQDNILLDGHHRLKVVKELNWEKIPVERKHFEDHNDEEIYVIETNVVRRQLNQAQKTIMGLKLEPLYAERAKQRKESQRNEDTGQFEPLSSNELSGQARDQAAERVGLSPATYYRSKYVLENGTIEQKNRFLAGEKKAGSLYREIKRKEHIKELKESIPELVEPTGEYGTIVVDPPWPYREYGNNEYDADGNRADSPYPEMSIKDIQAIKLPTSKNCILWLWTTNRFMHEAYHCLEAWGFEPKTILTWVKPNMGLGRWLRNQTEHCILAIKGAPIVDLHNETTVLNAPNRGHSIKPDEFYALVDSLCIGSKIDWFSRQGRPGWATFGTMEGS